MKCRSCPRGNLWRSIGRHGGRVDRCCWRSARYAPGRPAWERLLRGLMASGLRLGEAVALDWNDGPFETHTTGIDPGSVSGGSQKSRRSEVVPVTPDFAEWILGPDTGGDGWGGCFPLVDSKTG